MRQSKTERAEANLIPARAKWVKEAVSEFQPENDSIKTDTGKIIRYKKLVVCAGLQLNWNSVKGLSEALGKNGVTSNYRYMPSIY